MYVTERNTVNGIISCEEHESTMRKNKCSVKHMCDINQTNGP